MDVIYRQHSHGYRHDYQADWQLLDVDMMRLQIQVRRFLWMMPACSRKTFAEQFPSLAPTYARRTPRVRQIPSAK
jgi:hypothetical protein